MKVDFLFTKTDIIEFEYFRCKISNILIVKNRQFCCIVQITERYGLN